MKKVVAIYFITIYYFNTRFSFEKSLVLAYFYNISKSYLSARYSWLKLKLFKSEYCYNLFFHQKLNCWFIIKIFQQN